MNNKTESKTGSKPPGGIDVLSAGLGHMEITFNQGDPLEAARAERIITDMLKRGYALFIEGADKAMIRVERFDPKIGCYIVADGPTLPPGAEVVVEPDGPYSAEAGDKADRRRKGRRAVKATSVTTTAVGRSAGG